MGEQRFCMECGAKIEEGAVFCVECGTPVPQAETTVIPTNTPAQAPDPASVQTTATPVQTTTVQAPPNQVQAPIPQATVSSEANDAPYYTQEGSGSSTKKGILIGLGAGLGILTIAAAALFIVPRLTSKDEPASSTTVIVTNKDDDAEKEAEEAKAAEEAKKAEEEAAKKAEEEKKKKEEEEKAKNDYVIADSATKEYSKAELEKYSDYELYIARNEIYARHGRKFKNEDLNEYFSKKSWYKGTIEPDDFNDGAILSKTEQNNAKLMREIEESRNSPYLTTTK